MKKFVAFFSLFFLCSQFIYIPSTQTVYAAAVPSCTLGGNFDPFMGENTTFTVGLSNVGADTGFAPFIDLILPPEVNYTSSSYLGVATSPLGGVKVVTDNDGGDPLTGTVTSPITGEILTLPLGSKYLLIRYPLGSFTNTQGTATMTVNVSLDGGLLPDVALTELVSTRCGFELGEDPLDNPGTDPVLISLPSTSAVTPRIMQNRKSFQTTSFAQEGETVTGPNFPLTYTVSIDVADGETVTDSTTTDTLAPELVLTEILSVNDGGAGFLITYTPEVGAPQVSATVPFVLPLPSAGGSLEVMINSITGTASSADANFVYRAYISDLDKDGIAVLDPNTPNDTAVITNGVTTSATFNAAPTNAPLAQASVTAKAVAFQKTVSITNNLGNPGFTPGDTVRYTVGFQVSDYFSFDQLVVDDFLPDGVLYVDSSASVSITEDGVTTPSGFTENDLAEGSFAGSPVYDFAAECAGCTLAVIEDLIDDNDINTPDDGKTRLVFDIAALIGDNQLDGGLLNATPVGQPTQVVLTYDAIIQENFIDDVPGDQNIDATDVLINEAEVSFYLTSGTGAFGTDDSTASFSIVAPTFSKSIEGVVDNIAASVDIPPFINNPIRVNPGGGVIFSLAVTVPSGDLEDLVIQDFLPIPFFDATEVTTFDAATTFTPYAPIEGDLASVPAAGEIGYGPGTAGLLTPYPIPLIITNPADNTLTVDFASGSSFENDPSLPISIELLFHVTTTNDAFASNLGLVNVASFGGANSVGPIGIGTGLINMVTGGPNINTTKGVVDVSTLTPVYSPAVVGPGVFDGTLSPVFTAPMSSEDVGANPIGSSVDGVDAEDRVTFAVVLENDGTIPAFDITLTDTLPTGFRAPASAGELNLQVYDGGGNNLAAQTTGGLFGFIPTGGTTDTTDTSLVFNPAYSLPPYGNSGSFLTADGLADEGENILIITYDLYPDVTVDIESTLENTVILTNYTASPAGANYALNPANNQASATVEFLEPTMTKTASVHPLNDNLDTPYPNFSIGEPIRYTLEITVPEGTTSNTQIIDTLEPGLGFYLTNGVTIDTTAACTGTPFNGTVPSLTLTPPGPGVGISGGTWTIDFDGDIVAAGDNDVSNNTFCLYYDAVVLDSPQVTNGAQRKNSAVATYGSTGSIPVTESTLTTSVGALQISKGVTPTTGDAGDTFVYTLTVSHVSGSPMFDVEVTDIVPAELIINTNFSSDGIDNDGDGLIDGDDPDELDGIAAPFYDGANGFTFNAVNNANHGGVNAFDKVASGDSIVMRFEVNTVNSVNPAEVILNQADLQYDSYLGTPPVDIPQRVINTDDSASLTIDNLSVVKTIFSTSDPLTGTSQYNPALQDVTLGEQVVYRVAVTVPEGEMTDFTIADTLPDRMVLDSASVIQDDTGSAAPTIAFSDVYGDTFNDSVLFTFASVSNLPDADSEQIIVEIVGTLSDHPSNNAGQVKTNTVAVDFAENPGAPRTSSVGFDVVAPILLIEKSVDSSSGEGGDTLLYTIEVSHAGGSTAPAHDITIGDIIPADLTVLSNFSSDGLDNDGDGLIDGADGDEVDGVVASFYDGINLVWNQVANANHGGSNLYEVLPLGSSFTLQFRAQVDNAVSPSQTISNSAILNYTSGDTNPRLFSSLDSEDFLVENLVLSKSVTSTSFPETGTARFNGSLEDLAVGESVDYTITVGVPVSGFSNLIVTDTLPVGFEVTAASVQSSDPGISFTPSIGFINNVATYTIGDVTATSAGNIVLALTAVVTDDAAIVAGTGYRNNVSANFTENTGPALTAFADVDIVEPSITVDKSVNTLNGEAGDSFVFTIDVENTGSGPAFDLVMTDTVPADFTIVPMVSDGLDNDGDGVIDEVDEGVGAFLVGNTFTWNTATAGAHFSQLDPAGTFALQYRVTLDVTANLGDLLTNTAAINYDSAPGANANQRAGSDNNGSQVAVDLGTVAKTLGGPLTEKIVGEKIPFEVTITIPQGTTDPLVLTDTLPAGLSLDMSSVVATSSSGDLSIENTPVLVNAVPTTAAIVVGQSQVLTFTFGEVINSNTNGGVDETITLTYEAFVLDTADNVDGTTHVNTATIDFGGFGSDGPASAPAVTVEEPDLLLQKTTSYTSGNTATYTIRVENNASSSRASAHEVVITDVLPAGMNYAAGEVYTNVPAVPTVDISNLPTITYTFDEVPPSFNSANPILFSYNTVIPLGTAEGSVLTNNLSLAATGLDGIVAGERSYSESTSTNITVTRPNLSTSSKTFLDLNGGDPEAHDVLQYTLDIINTGNTAATGISVTDDLPVHTHNLTITSLPANGTNNSQPAPNGANGTGLLQFDNISLDAFGGPNDRVQIVYTVVVDAGVPDETIIANNVTISPALEGGSGGSDTASTGLDFPLLNVQKSVNVPGLVGGSAPLTYTIDITNVGTGDATNVTLIDAVPLGLTYVDGTLELDGNPLSSLVDADEGDFDGTNADAITVVIPTLAQSGGTAQIVFQASTPVVGSSTTFTNTVDVTDDQGSVRSSSVNVVLNPKSGGGAPGISGRNEKIVYGCFCNGSNVPSCARMVVGIDEEYQACTSNNQCSCGESPVNPIEQLLKNTEASEEEVKAEREIWEEKEDFEEKQAEPTEPLVCEEEKHERLFDNFLYTDRIPFTGYVSPELRAKYEAQTVLQALDANHPYYRAALDLVYQGIIDDYRFDSRIRIDEPLSRAEVAKIAARSGEISILRGEGCVTNKFSDVTSAAWYGDYVINLGFKGIVDGYSDGLYHAEKDVHFDEVLKIIVRTFGLTPELRLERQFEDWGQRYYDLLVAKNIVPGEMQGRKFDTPVTRGEMFEMISRTLQMKDSRLPVYQYSITMDVPSLGLENLNARQTLLSDSSVWLEALTHHGLGYYYDSPNENIIVFGHSSIWPKLDPTPYGAVFKRAINETKVGDEFSLTMNGQKKTYRIKTRDRVLWADYKFLQESDPSIDAIWFTCDTDLDYRWVFKAEEVE